MSSEPPVDKPAVTSGSGGIHKNPWNWVLLIPFVMLITPLFNSDEPRMFGLPFFYWFQFLCVPLGVICVAIVYVKTRHIHGAPSTDELDERERGR